MDKHPPSRAVSVLEAPEKLLGVVKSDLQRPAGLAEEAVITTEGLEVESVAGQEDTGDGTSARSRQTAGDDDAKGLEGRFGKTQSKLLDRRVHSRCEGHNKGLLPTSPGNPFTLSRESAGGPLFQERRSPCEASKKCKTLWAVIGKMSENVWSSPRSSRSNGPTNSRCMHSRKVEGRVWDHALDV